MQTGTPDPRSTHAEVFTHEGFTHTLAKPCRAASSHRRVMSASLASGLRSVWSTRLAQSLAVAASPRMTPMRAAPASTTRCMRSGQRLKHALPHPHAPSSPAPSPFSRATITSVICSTSRSKSPFCE